MGTHDVEQRACPTIYNVLDTSLRRTGCCLEWVVDFTLTFFVFFLIKAKAYLGVCSGDDSNPPLHSPDGCVACMGAGGAGGVLVYFYLLLSPDDNGPRMHVSLRGRRPSIDCHYSFVGRVEQKPLKQQEQIIYDTSIHTSTTRSKLNILER